MGQDAKATYVQPLFLTYSPVIKCVHMLTIKVVFLYETNFERSPSPEDYLEIGSPESPETVTDNPVRRDSIPSPAYPPITTQPSPRVPTKLLIPKNQHVAYGPFTPEQPHASHSKSPFHRDDYSPDSQSAQGGKRLSPSDRFLCQPAHLEDLLCQPNHTEDSVFPLLEWKNDQKEMAQLLRHFIQHLAIWVCAPYAPSPQ